MTVDKEFLYKLIKTGSPTGREQELQRYLHEWASSFADHVEADLLGNLAVVINPQAKLRVMLAGHCDRIGFIIMDITEEGLLRVDPLGGVDEATVLGSRVTIHTKNGDIPGVFGKVSTHLQKKQDKETVPTIDKMWIDIGAKDRKDAETKVALGDYISYELREVGLMGDRFAAPGLDNMLGVYAVMQTAKRCAAEGIDVALYSVSTVQEEIGSRGAESATVAIEPHVAIAVDTTLAADTPGQVITITTPKIQIGKGPTISKGPNTNPFVAKQLREVAQKNDIPWQEQPNAKPEGNDAKSMQIAGVGNAAGSVGIPIRNMHTQVEIASLGDLEATVDLLTSFVKSLNSDSSLMPINFDAYGQKKKIEVKQRGLGIHKGEKGA